MEQNLESEATQWINLFYWLQAKKVSPAEIRELVQQKEASQEAKQVLFDFPSLEGQL